MRGGREREVETVHGAEQGSRGSERSSHGTERSSRGTERSSRGSGHSSRDTGQRSHSAARARTQTSDPRRARRLDAPAKRARVAAVASDVREPLILPVIEEELAIEKRAVSTGGVRVKRRVQTIEKLIDVALRHDEVSVDRVEVGRFVSRPPAVRRDGETLVVPVLEEVVVFVKRWRLVAEVRITRKRVTKRVQQRVPLRSDAVEIERLPSHEIARGSTGSRSGNAGTRDRASVKRKTQARKP